MVGPDPWYQRPRASFSIGCWSRRQEPALRHVCRNVDLGTVGSESLASTWHDNDSGASGYGLAPGRVKEARMASLEDLGTQITASCLYALLTWNRDSVRLHEAMTDSASKQMHASPKFSSLTIPSYRCSSVIAQEKAVTTRKIGPSELKLCAKCANLGDGQSGKAKGAGGS